MSHEQENQSEKVTEANAEVVIEESGASLVDTLFDIGLAWAEFGVGQGKRALETSAKTLEKIAASLDGVQGKLRKDARTS
jgi:transcription initiation factor TFIIIB Brf1 subunit/transcription initiation factor TFIIB